MDVDLLKSFYITVEVGSISASAARQNMQQSALSRRIQQLEHFFKSPLFYRNSRGVTLTPQGELLYQHVGKIIRDLSSLKEKILQEEKVVKGHLRLSSSHAFITAWLNYFLAEFVETYPDLTLEIAANDRMLDLSIREADVGIRGFDPDETNLKQVYLASWKTCLYASPSYIDRYGAPKTIEDLDNHRLIAYGCRDEYGYGKTSPDWFLDLGRTKGEGSRAACLTVNSFETIIDMAQKGIGIINFYPEVRFMKDVNLVPILENIETPEVHDYIVFPKDLAGSPNVKALVDYFVSKVPASQRRQPKSHQI